MPLTLFSFFESINVWFDVENLPPPIIHKEKNEVFILYHQDGIGSGDIHGTH
jgi:hypothetical protein